MNVNNKTLVITDPCYIKSHATKYLEKSTIYGDWSCMCYKTTREKAKEKSKEWDKIYFDFFNKYNFTKLKEEEKKNLYDEFIKQKQKFIEENCYGEFCADSGMVAVFDYDSLTKNDKEFVDTHNWCACIIPNYSGKFDYVVETDDENNKRAHIVGDNFYTTQSAL